MGVLARGQATVNIAEPGDSPVIWSLVPTPTSVGRSEAGVCAPVSASCRLRLTVGSESEIVGVDKPIEYRGRNLCKGSSETETTVVQNYSPYLSTGIHKEEMLTVSFWIRGDVTGILSAYVNDDSGAQNAYCDFSSVRVTTDYVYHTLTAKATTGTGVWVGGLCMRLYSSSPDFKFHVKGYKLEKGTKATSWSPAPEDYALSLNGNPYTAGANYTIQPTDTELLWAGSLAGVSIDPVRVPIIKDGATGGRGIQGIKGVDGTQYYTWIRYSDNANGVPNDNDSTRPYIGIAVNKLTATESDIASDYRWSKITGDKGIKGDKGLDGKQLYTWMKYADTAQGSGLSDSAVGKSYIGFAYNKPTATESVTPSDYMWSKIKGDVGDSVTGKMLYRDPEFRKGVNGCYLYNYPDNGNVTISRIPKPADCPTTSTHCLEIRVTGIANPGHGGFYQPIQSRANAVFLQKIVAKVPVGYELNTARNPMGDGCTDEFITPRVGTGRYETYLRKTVCGTTGSFDGGGHVYLTGSPLPTPANPLAWQIASCTCYDLTDSEKYDDAIEQAQADADRANAELSMIASDSKFTPSEKQQTAIEWGRIQLEQAKNTATATTLNVPTGDIVMVFNTLNGYITPLLSNLSTTSDINGGQFRSTFAAWYEKNVALVNAISVANADKAADGVERDNRNLIKDSEYRPFGANNAGTGTSTLMKDESEWYQRAVADAGKEISLYGGYASLIAGNTYTMSVYLRQNSGVDKSVFLSNDIDFIYTSFNLPSGVWTRVTLPPWKSTVTGRVCLIVVCQSSALDYKRCKTERGTKATSWSPAPEDTAAAITAAQQAAEAYAKAQAEAAQVTANAYADGIVTAEEKRAIADATAKADAAKKAAIEAAAIDATTKANAAGAIGMEAKNRLDTWADDAQIAPGEKTALKQQQANIAAEYIEVSANATRYGVACTAYTTAYNAAYSALTKYTAPAPECITIEADYANIAAYYNARKTILEAIAVAIKKLQEDAITATSVATKDALAKELGYANYAAMQAEAAKGKTLVDGEYVRTSLIDVANLIAKQVDVINGTSRVKITPKNGMELLENNVQTATFSGRQITSISEMMPTSPNISIGEQSVTAEVNPAARSVVMSAGVVAQTTTNVSVEIPAITLYCTIDCLSNEVPTGLTCSVGLEVNGTTQWLEFPTKRFSEMMGDFKYGLAQREQKSIPAQIITVPATPFIGKYSAINVNLKYQFIYAAPNPVVASWRIGVYAKFEGNPPADPCTTRYLKVGGATFNAAFFGNGVLFSKAIDQYVGMSATAAGTELIARSGKFGIKVDKTGVANLDENGNWDNSMILVAAHMYHSGRIVSQCGVRRLIQGSQTSQGYYQITHKIGHTNYYVQATICDPSEWRASTIRVYAKTVDSFKVAITDSTTPNTGVGQEFDLLIYGKLQ